jgi:hypothetical protein
MDWDWECDQWQDVCTDSIDNEIDTDAYIDADTLNGMAYDPQWTVDHSGIGSDTVNRMLDGDNTPFDFNYIPGGYNSYMLAQVNDLLADLSCYNLAMFRLGHDADPLALEHEAARIKAGITGEEVWTSDGYQCNAQMCVLWLEPIPEITTQVTTGMSERSWQDCMDAVRSTSTENCLYWTTRCERDGFSKACSIAVNLGC